MEDRNRIPYNQEFDYRFIKPVRHSRNKTLVEFEHFMGVDSTVICRLEKGQIEFSPLYQERFKDAIKRLRISAIELASIRKIIEMKESRGYR
jgi:transcriptional regulator with XRE-family HTH domain